MVSRRHYVPSVPLTRHATPRRAVLPLQVIAVICVLVWVMNINRFKDPALGGWLSGALAWPGGDDQALWLAVGAAP